MIYYMQYAMCMAKKKKKKKICKYLSTLKKRREILKVLVKGINIYHVYLFIEEHYCIVHLIYIIIEYYYYFLGENFSRVLYYYVTVNCTTSPRTFEKVSFWS